MVAAEAGLGAKNTARTATDFTSCLHGRVWFRLFSESASHDLSLARAKLRVTGTEKLPRLVARWNRSTSGSHRRDTWFKRARTKTCWGNHPRGRVLARCLTCAR